MVEHRWLNKESPQSHEWGPGTRIINDDLDEASPVAGATDPNDLVEGEIYKGEVDEFEYNEEVDETPHSGIILLEMGHINLGPIDESAKGETVKFENVGWNYGKCLNEEYISDSYDPRDGVAFNPESRDKEESEESTSSSDSKSNTKSGTSTPVAPEVSSSEKPPEPPKIGSIVYHVSAGNPDCFHVTDNCRGLENAESELHSKKVERYGEPPEEISHLRPCMSCARGIF
jgi:hypothetical protein